MQSDFNVFRINNSLLNSNTFILWQKEGGSCWLLDPGDVAPIRGFMGQHNLQSRGILLTHYHFDHIYGVNCLREFYDPEMPIFCGELTREGLLDAKLNMSLYAGKPFVVEDKAIHLIQDNDKIELWDGVCVKAIYTPGHNDDCFSFFITDKLFTGDALIPHLKVHTKSKNADKLLAEQTVRNILRNFPSQTMIFPGHNDPCKINELYE